MKKFILISMASLMSFQSGAFAKGSSRVSDIVSESQDEIKMDKAELKQKLSDAQAYLDILKADLASAKEENGTYRISTSIRKGAIIAAGTSALVILGLGIRRMLPAKNTAGSALMMDYAFSTLAAISTVASTGVALGAHGMVVLTDDEIVDIEQKVQVIENEIQRLQKELA
ncbi:hypothetical protein D3C87_571710 [compost metagenome]